MRGRHARLVEEEVALLDGLVVHEGDPPRLGDDAGLAQLEQTLGGVEGVRRVDDRLAPELRLEPNARQDVQRIEELERAALELHLLGDANVLEAEEAREKLGGHSRDERVPVGGVDLVTG